MWTNGIQAACGYDCSNVTASPQCYFNYLAAATPNITRVLPLHGTVAANDVITIFGNGFDPVPAANSVLLGLNGICTVTNANSTMLQCSVPNLPADTYNLTVVVMSGAGLATGLPVVFSVVTVVSGISPSSAGVCGGDIITLTGTGFPVLGNVQVRFVWRLRV